MHVQSNLRQCRTQKCSAEMGMRNLRNALCIILKHCSYNFNLMQIFNLFQLQWNLEIADSLVPAFWLLYRGCLSSLRGKMALATMAL